MNNAKSQDKSNECPPEEENAPPDPSMRSMRSEPDRRSAEQRDKDRSGYDPKSDHPNRKS